ncbi:MAG: hypothetical protein KDC84_09865 [Crocinitomicaceae bacterium]|nr:hypothetical protein [Crocinitomicaceae bacterium]
MAVICLPWMIELGGWEDQEVLDNRELARKPEIGVRNFNEKWEKYYSDHYGLRNDLIAWGGFLKSQLLFSSPKPEIVIFGKGGWLFYNAKGDRIYDSYSNANTISPEEGEKVYEDYLWKIKRCEELNNAKFYKITWPNKHTVYKPLWSWKMKRQPVEDHSKRQQFMLLFNNKRSTNYIDLTEHLWKYKSQAQVYRKYDTHWNQLGAFYAYQYVAEKIFYKEQAMILDSFDLVYKDQYSGDLVKLMGLKEMLSPEKEPFLNFKGKLDTTITQYDFNGIAVDDFYNNTLKNKVLLIFGDSYIHRIQWLFLFHFHRVIFVKTGFNEEIIEKFKPDVVFEAKVERYL